MEKTSERERMERERTALFGEATRTVQAAEAQTRTVTAKEDARVLELMARVRTLEEQIRHLRRQSKHNEPRKGDDNQ
jgi:TPP-dependent pyruvate/acetoin dehydrogenase alpha subunit